MNVLDNQAKAFDLNVMPRSRIAKLLATAATVTLIIGSSAAKASSLDFVLANFTNQDIVRVWTAPAGGSAWMPVRGAFVMQAGGYQKIEFPYGDLSDTCRHHLKVQFAGGMERYWLSVNLCGITAFGVSVVQNEVKGYTY